MEVVDHVKKPKYPDPIVQQVLDNVHPRYGKNAYVCLGKLEQHKCIPSWDNQGHFFFFKGVQQLHYANNFFFPPFPFTVSFLKVF